MKVSLQTQSEPHIGSRMYTPYSREVRQVIYECPVQGLPEFTCFVWELELAEFNHLTNEVNRHFAYEVTFGASAKGSCPLGSWPDFNWAVISKLSRQQKRMDAWIDVHRSEPTTSPLLQAIEESQSRKIENDRHIQL